MKNNITLSHDGELEIINLDNVNKIRILNDYDGKKAFVFEYNDQHRSVVEFSDEKKADEFYKKLNDKIKFEEKDLDLPSW